MSAKGSDGLGRVNWWLKAQTPEGVKVIPGVCLTPQGREMAAGVVLWCYRRVRALLHHRDYAPQPGEVEDMAHEAAVKAAVTWDEGRGKVTTLAAWTCRAAVSNFFRHRDARPDRDAASLEAFGETLAVPGESEGAVEARRAEAAEHLGAVLARLRPADREVLESAYLRGETCEGRAALKGYSRQAASEERKRAMGRARKAARAISKGVA